MSTCSLQSHHDDFSRHGSEKIIPQGGDQETHYSLFRCIWNRCKSIQNTSGKYLINKYFVWSKYGGKYSLEEPGCVYFQPFILTLFLFVPDVLQPFIQIHIIFQIYESGYEIRAVIVCISIFYPP